MKIRLRTLLWSTCVSAAMALSAHAAVAPKAQACAAGTPTAASYTWDFKGEANAIFKDIQSDAQAVRYHADTIHSYAGESGLDWQAQGDELEQMKDRINDIGEKLCRLETIRRVLAPWQQHVVDQIAVTTRLMADNAQDAIEFGNTKSNALWLPAYQKYVSNLYDEAVTLTHSTGNAVEFPSVSKEYRDLGQAVGFGGKSQ